jgi:acyl-CoA synthetase (AMP-forming)/AMP-acid ligase II
MLTSSCILALVPTANEALGLGRDTVSLVVMPLFHVAGAGWALFGLCNGARNVMLRGVDLPAILEAIPKYGVTDSVFVPAVLQFLLMTPGVEDTDFSSLRTIVYGASPISEDVLVRSIETFGCRFVQAYGLTETNGAVVLLPAEDHDPHGPNRHRLRAAGAPLPGVEIRVVDDEGTSLPPGEVGEIWIRSPSNMAGYWNMPEATAEAITADGWFRSGDAGYLDDDGYLYIHDRVKDMIVTGGENVYPAEVESALMAHPGLADVAVIGVPDERWGETVKAICVCNGEVEDRDALARDVLAFARERLAHYKCPTSVDWVDVLPRNPSGKVLKKDLREPYWQGHDRRVS